MSEALKNYFSELITRVESGDEVSNAGRDDDGFFRPTRTILLRNLALLRDLHDKPRARDMVKAAWASVLKDLPPEWLELSPEIQDELKDILK